MLARKLFKCNLERKVARVVKLLSSLKKGVMHDAKFLEEPS